MDATNWPGCTYFLGIVACSEFLIGVFALTDQTAKEATEEGSRYGGPPQRWLHRTEGRLGSRTLREADSRRKGLRSGRDD